MTIPEQPAIASPSVLAWTRLALASLAVICALKVVFVGLAPGAAVAPVWACAIATLFVWAIVGASVGAAAIALLTLRAQGGDLGARCRPTPEPEAPR